jgi:hypothetical protein
MSLVLMVCLLAVGAICAALKPAWASFCVNTAGVMVVVYVVVQVVRALLAGG